MSVTYLNLFFFASENVRDSNISGCQNTEEPNIARGGRKVLFVRRKPSEQTGWWDNGPCGATTNHRGWVLCFGEFAENTKPLKRCAHLGYTDDTGLLIQNAAQPHTANSQPEIDSPTVLLEIILNVKYGILNCVSDYVFRVNPSAC